jgi:ADP-heptose:LPS heptosyltransferase
MEERGDFQELVARDMANYRPYHTGKTPERWSYNLDFRPDVGEIYFAEREREFGARYADRIIVEPHIGPNASPNKSWGWVRWNKLCYLMQRAGLRVTQLGPLGTKLLDGADFIITPSFRAAAAVLAHSRAAVLPEGGLHHAAAALGIQAVVIFGGFTPIELTGYPMHRNLGASLTEACGKRVKCTHCDAAMAAITPERVMGELEQILVR